MMCKDLISLKKMLKKIHIYSLYKNYKTDKIIEREKKTGFEPITVNGFKGIDKRLCISTVAKLPQAKQ